MANKYTKIIILIILCLILIPAVKVLAKDQVPVAAPMTTEYAGKSGNIAVKSVLRILCPSKNRNGTGFLHKSGGIITAAHVVEGCTNNEVLVVSVHGKIIHVSDIKIDEDLDLSQLTLVESLKATALSISQNDKTSIGAQVSTWGFPSGYSGRASLLSSGYISGIDHVKTRNNKVVGKLVVNAAFNSGNSGGPLIEIENGTVIGVVSSKLAPLPQYIESALKALKEAKYGLMFNKTLPDGTKESVSQAQVVEEILQYLRSQTQLVIGYAVLGNDLKGFLKANGIEP